MLEASYAYDAFGRRVRKDLGASGALDYHYDPDGRLLAESDPAPSASTSGCRWTARPGPCRWR